MLSFQFLPMYNVNPEQCILSELPYLTTIATKHSNHYRMKMISSCLNHQRVKHESSKYCAPVQTNKNISMSKVHLIFNELNSKVEHCYRVVLISFGPKARKIRELQWIAVLILAYADHLTTNSCHNCVPCLSSILISYCFFHFLQPKPKLQNVRTY